MYNNVCMLNEHDERAETVPGGICIGLNPGLMKGGGGTPGGKEGGGMPMCPGKTGGWRAPTPTIGCCIGGI